MSGYIYENGEIVEGVVIRLKKSEAIVDLPFGGQGTFHANEIDKDSTDRSIKDHYKLGEVDAFRVVYVDQKLGTVGLGLIGDYTIHPTNRSSAASNGHSPGL